jgi:signal peptidase I
MKIFSIPFLFLALFSCGFNELPEPSMKDKLRVEDFLFIEKLSYGVQDSIKNKLGYPLIHNELAVDSISLLKDSLTRNDIIVF